MILKSLFVHIAMKKNILIRIISFISFLTIIICIFFISDKSYNHIDKRSASEIICSELIEFSDIEKNRVLNFLSDEYYEDTSCAGFVKDNGIGSYDLSYLVLLSSSVSGKISKSILDTIDNVLEKGYIGLSPIEVCYYVTIAEYRGFDIDNNDLFMYLNNYYIEDIGLFYNYNIDDSDSIYYGCTWNLINIIGDDLVEHFNLKYSINKLYEESCSVFVFDDSSSMYNCGGAILQLYYIVNNNLIITEKLVSWYEDWKTYYDSILTTSNFLSSQLLVSVSKIYRIIDINYTNIIFDSFLIRLEYNDITNLDYQLIYNILEYSKFSSNSETRSNVENLVKEYTKNISNIYTNNANVDIENTLYGILLADILNFNYSKEKILNYINDSYIKAKTSTNLTEVAYILYFGTTIECVLCDSFVINLNDSLLTIKEIEEFIHNIISNLENEDLKVALNIINYISSMVSNLNLRGINVEMKLSDVNIIKSKLKEYVKNDSDFESFYFIYYLNINECLNICVISNEKIQKNIDNLFYKGSFTFSKDLKETSLQMTCNYNQLLFNKKIDINYDSIKNYIFQYESEKLYSNVSGKITICDTYYGNVLNALCENRGTSNDKN